MIVSHSTHPDEQQLASFLGGRLPADQMDLIVAHLEHCDSCCERLDDLTEWQKDTLLTQLRVADSERPNDTDDDTRREAVLQAIQSCATLPGDALPGYELLEEIGRGGMGVVYKARDLRLKRLVALKVILAGSHSTQQQRRLFQTEAETIARLDHANIVQIHEVGEHDGRPYLVMELLEGGNLQDFTDRHPLAARTAADIVRKLAQAVQYAHEQGVIHRDLKPDNVLMKSLANPKITDFGLAKQVDSRYDQTKTGTILGTPSYMAPEQTTGNVRMIGAHSDVYSLGAILYELLTGHTPFQADCPWEAMRMTREDEPIPPTSLHPRLPRDLETICLRCLEKEPRRRYASATALADDLGRYLSFEPVQARRIGPAGRALKWTRRKPMAAAFVSVLAAVFLIGLPLMTGLAAWAWREKGEAEYQRGEAIAASREAETSRLKANAAALAARRSEWKANQRVADLYSAEGIRELDDGNYYEAFALTVRSLEQESASRASLPPEAFEGEELRSRRNDLLLRGEQILRQYPTVVARTILSLPEEPADEPVTLAAQRLMFSDDDRELIAIDRLGYRVHRWKIGSAPISVHEASSSVSTPLRYGNAGRWLMAVDGDKYGLWNVDSIEHTLLPVPKTLAGKLRESIAVKKLLVGPNMVVAIPRLIRHNPRDVLVWCRGTGDLPKQFNYQVNYIEDAWLSPGGKWLLLRVESKPAASHSLLIADVKTGEPLELTVPLLHAAMDGDIGSVALSRDDRLVAAAGVDGVRVLPLDQTGRPDSQARLLPVSDPAAVVRMEFDATSQRLLTADRNGVAAIWDVESGRALTAPMRHDSSLVVARFSPDDSRVLTASNDGRLRIWNAGTGQPLTPYLYHDSALLTATWSHQGDLVAAIERSGAITIWDLKSASRSSRLLVHNGPVHVVRFASDSRRLATACEDGVARIWDADSGAVEAALPHGFPVRDVQWNAEADRLAVHICDWNEEATGTRAAALWNTKTATPVISSLGRGIFSRGPREICYSPSGKHLVLGLRYFFNLFDLSTRRDVYRQNRSPERMTFSPDGRQLAYVLAGTVCVAESRTGQETHRFSESLEAPVARMTYSPDGRCLAAAGEFGLRIWDLQAEPSRSARRWKSVVDENPAGLLWVEFHPDFAEGSSLFTITDTLRCQAWNIQTGRRQGKPFQIAGVPILAQFRPRTHQIVTVTNTGESRVWNWHDGESVTPTLYHGSQANSASLSPDGRYLAVGGNDGAVLVWTLPAAATRMSLDDLKQAATRNGLSSPASSNNENVMPRGASTDEEADVLFEWHLRQAGESRRQRLWSAAAIHQKRCLQLRPGDLRLRRQYARALQKNNQLAEAVAEWSNVLAADDTRDEDWLARGALQVALGRSDEAFSDFKQAAGRDPGNGAAFMWQCLLHIQARRPAEADKAYLAAANLAWRVHETVINDRRRSGRETYQIRRRWQPLLTALSQLIDRWPENEDSPPEVVKAMYFRARGLSRAIVEHWKFTHVPTDSKSADRTMSRLFKPWLEDFRAALRLNTDDGFAHFALALLAFHRGDWQEADQHLDSAIEHAPDQRDIYFLAALTKIHQKLPLPELREALNRAIDSGEDHAGTRFHRGEVWRMSGNVDEAIADYSQAIEYEPSHTQALSSRGNVWSEVGEWEQAHEDFRRVLTQPGGLQTCGRDYVLAALLAGRLQEARTASQRLLFNSALTLSDVPRTGDWISKYLRLACLQRSFARDDLARYAKRLTKIIDRNGEAENHVIARAIAHFRMGAADAVEDLLPFAEQREDAALWLFVALAQHKLGQAGASLRSLRKARRLDERSRKNITWQRRAELELLFQEASPIELRLLSLADAD